MKAVGASPKAYCKLIDNQLFASLPSSLFHLTTLTKPNQSIQIELDALFKQRKYKLDRAKAGEIIKQATDSSGFITTQTFSQSYCGGAIGSGATSFRRCVGLY